MSPGVPTKLAAASLGLAGFAIALVAGLAADNPADVVLGRALVALLLCNLAGWIAGVVAERTVAEGVARYREANPGPDEKASLNAARPAPGVAS